MVSFLLLFLIPVGPAAATGGVSRSAVESSSASSPVVPLQAQESLSQPTKWGALMDAADEAVEQGRFSEGEQILQAAITEAETLGPENKRLGASLSSLGALYALQRRYQEAETLFTRSSSILDKAVGPDHYLSAMPVGGLASAYLAQSRFAEAEPLLRRVLMIREKVLGLEAPEVSLTLNNLAIVYRAQQRYAEAEALYKRALAIAEKTYGTEHPQYATTLVNYAIVLRLTGRDAEADTMEVRGKAILANRKR